MIIKAKVETNDGQDMTLIVNEITSLSESVFKTARKLTLSLGDVEKLDHEDLGRAFTLLGGSTGACTVYFRVGLEKDGLEVDVHAAPLRVLASTQLEKDLNALGFITEWEFAA